MVGLSMLAMGAYIGTPGAPRAQTVNCAFDLVFGSVIPCAGTGKITVEPTGSVSTSGCVTTGGSQSQARCIIIQGFPIAPLQVSVTAPSYLLDNGGGDTMVVNGINLETPAGGLQYTFTDFFTSLDIGATLNVQANQPGGSYTGTFTVNAVFL